MSIVAELMTQPGVIAAGEFAYRGDRFSYRGQLDEEQARMLSIVCRATTMTANMEAHLLAGVRPSVGIKNVRGWLLRGPAQTLCVYANTFCLFETPVGSPNRIVSLLSAALASDAMDLI